LFEALGLVGIVNLVLAMLTATVLVMRSLQPRRTRVLPDAVVLVNCTTDQASSNIKLLSHLVAHFLKVFGDTVGNDQAVMVALTSSLCLAHQVHICSRSQYGKLGGVSNTSLKGTRFLSGLIGAAHIFGASRYFIPIFVSILHQLRSLQIMLPVEAAVAGVSRMTDDEA
jgi:hypothetical protein